MDHAAALGYCLGAADRTIRDHGRSREVATVVAEALPNGGLMNTFKKIPTNCTMDLCSRRLTLVYLVKNEN